MIWSWMALSQLQSKEKQFKRKMMQKTLTFQFELNEFPLTKKNLKFNTKALWSRIQVLGNCIITG